VRVRGDVAVVTPALDRLFFGQASRTGTIFTCRQGADLMNSSVSRVVIYASYLSA
jgi:hypothetical protein